MVLMSIGVLFALQRCRSGRKKNNHHESMLRVFINIIDSFCVFRNILYPPQRTPPHPPFPTFCRMIDTWSRRLA